MRSTPPRASTRSYVMSNRRYLKLVLPRLATRIFMTPFRQDALTTQRRDEDRFFPSGDHMRADQFAISAGGLTAGVDRGANGADVTADKRGHIGAADLHLARQSDVGRFAHRVGRGDG